MLDAFRILSSTSVGTPTVTVAGPATLAMEGADQEEVKTHPASADGEEWREAPQVTGTSASVESVEG